MVLLVSVWDSAGRGAVRGSVLQFLVLEPGLLHREEGIDQSPIVSTNHNLAFSVHVREDQRGGGYQARR